MRLACPALNKKTPLQTLLRPPTRTTGAGHPHLTMSSGLSREVSWAAFAKSLSKSFCELIPVARERRWGQAARMSGFEQKNSAAESAAPTDADDRGRSSPPVTALALFQSR